MNINQHFNQLVAQAAEADRGTSELLSQRDRLFKDNIIPALVKRGANDADIVNARTKWNQQTDKQMQSAGLLPKSGQSSRSFEKDKRAERAIKKSAETGSKWPIIKETIISTGENIGNTFGQGVGSMIEGAAGFVRDIGENEQDSIAANLANYGKNLRKGYEDSASTLQKEIQSGEHGKIPQLAGGAIQSTPAMALPFGAAWGARAAAAKMGATASAPYIGLGVGVAAGHTQNYGEVRRNATANLERDFPTWEQLQGNPVYEQEFQKALDAGVQIDQARKQAHATALDQLSENAADVYGTAMTGLEFIAPSGAVLGSGILKKAPNSKISQALAGGKVNQALVSKHLNNAPKGVSGLIDTSLTANMAAAKMVGKQALEEGLQGAIGEYGAQSASANIGGQAVNWGDVGSAFLEEAVVGGVMGGGMQSASRATPNDQAKDVATQLRNQTNRLRREEAQARQELSEATQLGNPDAIADAQANLNNIGAEALKVKEAYTQYGQEVPYFVDRFAAQYQPKVQPQAAQQPPEMVDPMQQPQEEQPAAPSNSGPNRQMASTTNLVMKAVSHGVISVDEANAIQSDPLRGQVFDLSVNGDKASAHGLVMQAVSGGQIDPVQAQDLIASIDHYASLGQPAKPKLSSIVDNHVKSQIEPQDDIFGNAIQLDSDFEPVTPGAPSFSEHLAGNPDFSQPKIFSNPSKANQYIQANKLQGTHEAVDLGDGTITVRPVQPQGGPELSDFGYGDNLDSAKSNLADGLPEVIAPVENSEPQGIIEDRPKANFEKPKVFNNYVLANYHIKENKLKDTHEIVKLDDGRAEVRPKSVASIEDFGSDQAFDDMLNAVPPIGTPITKPQAAQQDPVQPVQPSEPGQSVSFADQIRDAHLNNPKIKPQLINEEVAKGRPRSEVLKEVADVVKAANSGTASSQPKNEQAFQQGQKQIEQGAEARKTAITEGGTLKVIDGFSFGNKRTNYQAMHKRSGISETNFEYDVKDPDGNLVGTVVISDKGTVYKYPNANNKELMDITDKFANAENSFKKGIRIKKVRTYFTRSGKIGAEIKRVTHSDGRISYSYSGEWGAGSVDAKTMQDEENGWKAKKHGYTIQDHEAPATSQSEQKADENDIQENDAPEGMKSGDIGRKSDNQPFANKSAANTALKKKGLEGSHEVFELAPSSFVLRKKTEDAPKQEEKPAEKPKGRTLLGKNKQGHDVYEDERGVRSYYDPLGVFISENVTITPNGIEFGGSRGSEYEVVEQTDKVSKDESTNVANDDKKAIENVDKVASKSEKPETSKKKQTENKIFTEEAAEKARELLRKKLSGRLNSGIDPEIMQAGITLAGYHIEKGARKFSDYAANMIADLGDMVKPYLKSWYMGVKYDPRAVDFEGMSDAAEVENFNLDSLDQAENPATNPDNTQEVENESTASSAADTPAAEELRDPGRSTQSDDSQGDHSDVDAGVPGGSEAPKTKRTTSRSGIRSSTKNVGNNGGTTRGRDESDRREGTGRADPLPTESTTVEPESPAAIASTAQDFVMHDPESIIGGTPVKRFDKNKAALELLEELQAEGRQATPEEQAILAGYTGWGSFGQELFQGTWSNPVFKDEGVWKERSLWLRERLGQEAWESAKNSTINAHFTDPHTVRGMWSMAEKMGFTGGRVLEPAIGTGNFISLMPQHLKARSQVTGIDLDITTAAISSQLFPESNIQNMPYQQSKTPDNFYDLVISNVPFADIKIADRRYNQFNPNLHDYFFLKALDQVRPGGIVMAITSSGTMDKQNEVIRRELAKRAELITSVRLPSGAFKEYAGTAVVTDVIVLRKREMPLAMVEKKGTWIEIDEMRTSSKPVKVNSYYVQNPQNVLGVIDYGHGTTRYGAGMIVHRPADLDKQLAKMADFVPENALLPRDKEDNLTYYANKSGERTNIVTVSDGNLMYVYGDQMVKAEDIVKYAIKSEKDTAKRKQSILDLHGLRQAYHDLVDAERSDSNDIEAKRKTLKNRYQDYVKAHGPLSKSFGLQYFKKIEDADYYTMAALESDGQPAQIMERSVVRGKSAIENPSVAEAFVIVRNKSTNPSIKEIAKLAKTTEEKALKELLDSNAVYELPNGDIQPTDMYLSGNVRHKLAEAQEALRTGNTAMERNIEALQEVIPKDIPYFNIEAKVGATWVPLSDYQEYAAHMLGRANTDGIQITMPNGKWKVKIDKHILNSQEAQTNFGSKEKSFNVLLQAALSNQNITIKRKDPEGGEYVDMAATEEVNGKIGKIKEEFEAWLWQDPERRVRLENEYNQTFNAWATPKYDGSFMQMQGMALSLGNGPFNLRQHQQNAIWRALVNRKSINAHEVGTGKTFTMGGIAIESRRYGLAKKPLILAHNANSAAVAKEIQMMYPAARVLFISEMGKDARQKRLRQIANDDWDVVVMPHSMIDKLTLSEDTLMELAADDIAALEAELEEALAEESPGTTLEQVKGMTDEQISKELGFRAPTAKEVAKARLSMIEKIQKQAQESSKADAVNFEELGIDMIMVDEVHEFKKPSIATRMKMKGLNTGVNKRSSALQLLTRYVRRMNNGGNVHTFTGTPITNTLTEIYHQMRYVMEEEMSRANVSNWDGWFGSFATDIQDIELSSTGDYQLVTRLAGFVNVPELRKMIGQYMDIVFASDMPEMQPRKTASGKLLTDENLSESERAELLNGRTEGAKDRPYKKVINVTTQMSPEQEGALRKLQDLAKQWEAAPGKQKREWMRKGDPRAPLSISTAAKKASYDVRINDPEMVGQEGIVEDSPLSKSAQVVKNVMEIYHSDPRASQVIFTDSGYNTSAERSTGLKDKNGKTIRERVKVFSPVRHIVERLVQSGVPREEIAIVDGSVKAEQRKAIADKVNTGEVRIVIGLTQTLGVGVNMQKNLRAMHHLDAPWMPGELEQRNGRGLRQGNQWNTVLEYRYITDKLDGKFWQVLAVKERFINAFMKADDNVRRIEGDAAADNGDDTGTDIMSSFSEAAGDPRVLKRIQLKGKLDTLQRKENLHTRGIADMKRTISNTRSRIEQIKSVISQYEDSRHIDEVLNLLKNQSTAFKMSVDGKKFDKRKDAEEALKKFIDENIRLGSQNIKVAEYAGVPLYARWGHNDPQASLSIDLSGFEYSGNTLRGLEGRMRDAQKSLDKLYADKEAAERTVANLTAAQNTPFAQAEDLKKVSKQLDELETDMKENPVAAPIWLRTGAPTDSEVYYKGQLFAVTGHSYTDDGYFVLAEDTKGAVRIPYLEATDRTGMPLYEEHDFEAPKIENKTNSEETPGEEGKTQHSRRSGTGAGSTPGQVRAELKKRFGDDVIQQLEDSGLLIIEQTYSEPGVEGFAENGRVTLIADAITAENIVPVFLHELGGHIGLQGVLKPQAYENLMKDFNRLVAAGDPTALEAKRLAERESDAEVQADEYLPYLITVAAQQQAKQGPVKRLVNRIVSAVKAWAVDKLGVNLQLNANDILALAERMVKQVPKHTPPTGPKGGRRYSRSSNPQNMSRSRQREFFESASQTALGEMALRNMERGKTLSRRTLNLFQTMLHKALTDESGQFKKTFDLVQGKINHVTFMSSKSMDAAPSVLTQLEEGSDYWKEAKRVGKTLAHKGTFGKVDKAKIDTDLDKVGKVLFENTLTENSERHTEKELRQLGFDQDQIDLYMEIRESIDTSLDTFANTTFSNIYKHLGGTTEEVLELAGRNLDITDHYNEVLKMIDKLTKGKPEKADARQAAIEAIDRVYKKANDLKDQGYVPLMRFGKYFVRIYNPTTGEVAYRQHFESESERNMYFREREKQKDSLPAGFVVEKGQINELQHKLFQGISPETVALFAQESGLPIGDAETAYIKYAVQNNHALKRLLKRQGIDGFDTDIKRVLASFVLSNARYSANQTYNPAIDESITEIEDAAYQEDAIRLRDYALDTQEELSGLKNFAFVWYMGFSVMFGLVNLTQPLLQTFPYLMQYSKEYGVTGTAFLKAINTWRKGADHIEDKYKVHYEKARKEGHLDPQNTWMLQGLERGKSGLGASVWQLISHSSGMLAQASETVNRRTTLFAALDVAESLGPQKLKDLGFKDAYDFAVRAIQETQGIYNKGNRPRVSRGNVGSMLMLYKQFMIAYIEQMARMQKSGLFGGEDDEFKKNMAKLIGFGISRPVLIALGILMSLSGATGLPFVRDILDGVETVGGMIGKPVNTEREVQIALHNALGATLGGAVNTALMDGFVNLQPIVDVKGRMSMGDLIPATAYFSPTTSEYQKGSEAFSLLGSMGGLVEKANEAVQLAKIGAYGQAGVQLLPKAATSLGQGGIAAVTGDYRNMKTGVKTNEATVLDGVVKMLDAQPSSIAKEGRVRGLEMRDRSVQQYVNARWRERYEEALSSGDTQAIREIKQQIRDYNATDPRYPVTFNQKRAETNHKKANQKWQDKRKNTTGLEWMDQYNPYIE